MADPQIFAVSVATPVLFVEIYSPQRITSPNIHQLKPAGVISVEGKVGHTYRKEKLTRKEPRPEGKGGQINLIKEAEQEEYDEDGQEETRADNG